MFKILSKLYFLQNSLGFFISMIPPFLIHNLGKYLAIKKAFYLVGLEHLKGDYIEFGVFTGSSMACAIQCSQKPVDKNHTIDNFFGFDSFSGFGEVMDSDKHPFYTNLNFQTDYASVTKRLLKLKKKKQNVKLIKGYFESTCEKIKPDHYGIEKAAVVLIDCDTYTASKSCLNFITDIIQEGTIIIVDDFFSYKGSELKGVAGTLKEWSKINNINIRKISDYGMGGVVYIVSDFAVKTKIK